MLKYVKILPEKDVKKREPLSTADANVNWCSHNGKQYGAPSKN